MSGPTNTPENELSSTLQRRADEFARRGGHDLDLTQVMSRAGEIRRGRRMRASMMMAAVVLAVAVPVGIAVINNDPSRPSPGPPIATDPATPSPTVSDTSAIGLGDLPIGDTTEVGFADDSKIYLPDRSIALSGDGETRALAWVGGGFLVARDDGSGNQRVSYVAIEGGGTDLTWPYDGSGFAVSPARDIGAFVEPDGTVRAVQDSGTRNYPLGKLPAGDTYVVDAVTGENCSGRSDLDATCDVYLHGAGEHPALWVASPNAAPRKITEPEFEGFTKLTGINTNNDLVGMISASGTGSCWAVRTSDGSERWHTCEYSLISLSPEGRYVLATGGQQSGAGDSKFVILDEHSGTVVLELNTVKDGFISQRAWEDGDHVIVTVYDHGKWALERISVSTGERQYAGLLNKAGDGELLVPDDGSMVSPYQLSAAR